MDAGPVGSEEERRRDRQMLEILNELRIALPGVQILFAFLLTVPFTQRFGTLTTFKRELFYVTLMATALSTVLLIGPDAAHRLRFHQGELSWLIASANGLTIAGLVALAVAIGGAVLLVSDLVVEGVRAWISSALLWLVLVGIWFARPLARTRADVRRRRPPT